MNENLVNHINEVRRDFSGLPLNEDSVNKDPFKQFSIWFEEAVNAKLLDPSAMSVTTVSVDGQPSTRVVYMRGINENGFVFYTNYNSKKGKDLDKNNQVSLNFFWAELNRQVRVEGVVEKITDEASDSYFSERPRESQIGAWASNQSELLINREALEDNVTYFTTKFEGGEVPRPPHWGGYVIKPAQLEFWQGRPSRLHDRILYINSKGVWKQSRLSP
tara:strand:- start:8 stop:661 length:654 start_codon:yes stop_codon:yes gene_type:complete